MFLKEKCHGGEHMVMIRETMKQLNLELNIIISYSYENTSYENGLYISSVNFKVYDKDNNLLQTYPVLLKYPQEISVGRKTDATMAYALNNDQNYVELEYYDNVFNSKYDSKFKIEW